MVLLAVYDWLLDDPVAIKKKTLLWTGYVKSDLQLCVGHKGYVGCSMWSICRP